MDYKKIISDVRNNSQISQQRYESSQIFFIWMSVLFFLNYLFVGMAFGGKIAFLLLPISYAAFLWSLGMYIFLFCEKYIPLDEKKRKLVLWGIVLLWMVLYIPFLVGKGSFSF